MCALTIERKWNRCREEKIDAERKTSFLCLFIVRYNIIRLLNINYYIFQQSQRYVLNRRHMFTTRMAVKWAKWTFLCYMHTAAVQRTFQWWHCRFSLEWHMHIYTLYIVLSVKKENKGRMLNSVAWAKLCIYVLCQYSYSFFRFHHQQKVFQIKKKRKYDMKKKKSTKNFENLHFVVFIRGVDAQNRID